MESMWHMSVQGHVTDDLLESITPMPDTLHCAQYASECYQSLYVDDSSVQEMQDSFKNSARRAESYKLSDIRFVQRTENDARDSRNAWWSKNTWKQHAAENAKSCSFDARSTTMYLADRTTAECKPHVESAHRWIHKVERANYGLECHPQD
jgi:hypothetical protein